MANPFRFLASEDMPTPRDLAMSGTAPAVTGSIAVPPPASVLAGPVNPMAPPPVNPAGAMAAAGPQAAPQPGAGAAPAAPGAASVPWYGSGPGTLTGFVAKNLVGNDPVTDLQNKLDQARASGMSPQQALSQVLLTNPYLLAHLPDNLVNNATALAQMAAGRALQPVTLGSAGTGQQTYAFDPSSGQFIPGPSQSGVMTVNKRLVGVNPGQNGGATQITDFGPIGPATEFKVVGGTLVRTDQNGGAEVVLDMRQPVKGTEFEQKIGALLRANPNMDPNMAVDLAMGNIQLKTNPLTGEAAAYNKRTGLSTPIDQKDVPVVQDTIDATGVPSAQKGSQGLGSTSIEDFADLGTGAVSGVVAGISNTAGQAAPALSGLQTQAARQNLRTFVQVAKQALVNNSRFPTYEQKLIESIIPGPEMLANPAVVKQTFGQLRDTLATMKAQAYAQSQAKGTALNVRKQLLEKIQTIDAVTALMGPDPRAAQNGTGTGQPGASPQAGSTGAPAAPATSVAPQAPAAATGQPGGGAGTPSQLPPGAPAGGAWAKSPQDGQMHYYTADPSRPGHYLQW